jgi:hypothetical protein
MFENQQPGKPIKYQIGGNRNAIPIIETPIPSQPKYEEPKEIVFQEISEPQIFSEPITPPTTELERIL